MDELLPQIGINKYTLYLIIYLSILHKKCKELHIPIYKYPFVPLAIKKGFNIGDFYSGLGHYFLDTFDIKIIKQVHKNFRRHHDNPLSMEKYKLIQSLTEVMPISSSLLYFLNFDEPLLQLTHIISTIVLSLTQINHRYAHRRTHENDIDKNGNKVFYIPKIIKILQDNNIMLNNHHHKKHHQSEIENYCISNGSTSHILDTLIYYLDLPISTYKSSNNKHKIYKNKKHYNKLHNI